MRTVGLQVVREEVIQNLQIGVDPGPHGLLHEQGAAEGVDRGDAGLVESVPELLPALSFGGTKV